MADNIVLTGGVRQNLLALQGIADMMNTTQTRLASGKKVNTPLDSAVNFFTSAGLQSRSSDLAALLDAMSNSIQTVNAANHGITSIVTTVQSMQSTLMQARQDATWQSTSFTLGTLSATAAETMTISGGAVTGTVSTDLTTAQGVLTGGAYTALDFDNGGAFTQTLTFDIAANGGTARTIVVTATNLTTLSVTVDGGAPTTFPVVNANTVTSAELSGALNAAFDAATTPVAITASTPGATPIVFTADTAADSSSAAVTVTGVVANGPAILAASFGFAAGTASLVNGTAKSIDAIVNSINANVSLIGFVKAANDAGTLRIQNLSTAALSIGGASAAGGTVLDGTVANATSIGGNTVRKTLTTQYNQLRDQLDKFSADASFNGINLLQGDILKVIFNEQSTSTLDIVAKDVNGNPFVINATNLGIDVLVNSDLDSNANIDLILNSLTQSLQMARTQASGFGSSLSIVQNRQDFTKQMISTLKTGADNLVVADTNEEGANMLALQTRQQLSIAALSLANQANQSVLRLFG